MTSLNFNNLAVLDTSAKTFNIPKDVDANTTAIKTTDGITATNVSEQRVLILQQILPIDEITESMTVAGHMRSMQAISNLSDSSIIELRPLPD